MVLTTITISACSLYPYQIGFIISAPSFPFFELALDPGLETNISDVLAGCTLQAILMSIWPTTVLGQILCPYLKLTE